MKFSFLSIILIVLGLIFFNACQSDKAPKPVESVDTTQIDSSKFTYNLRVKEIFDTKCNKSGCHSAISAQSGVVLADYTTSKNSTRVKKVICAMEWGTGCQPMPQNEAKLPDSTINAVRIWQAKNYPE